MDVFIRFYAKCSFSSIKCHLIPGGIFLWEPLVVAG